MTRSFGLPRGAVPVVLALMAGLLVPLAGAGVSEAEPSASELTYACAKKSNGTLRVVGSLSGCRKGEVQLTLKPGPVKICVQPSGSMRYVTSFAGCRPPAQQVTLPPTSGTDYFCASGSGVLRYVSDASQCTAEEMPYQVTPNDAAPTVVSTSPQNGAPQVSTNTVPVITFSESVNVANGAVLMTCNGLPVSVSGASASSVTTLVLTPASELPEGADCEVTVSARGVTDVDTVDPPDAMASNFAFGFSTDEAPRVASTVPVNGTANVDANADIVVRFSEPVTADGSSFTLVCGGTAVAFTTSGSGTDSITVDPTAALPVGACVTTVVTSNVRDVDAADPPDRPDAHSFGFTVADGAPTVASTVPADGAVDVATDADLEITFSESVTMTAASYSVECPVGTPQGYTISTLEGSTVSFKLAGTLPEGAVCTVTVFANQITDSDLFDPPNTMAADYTFSFTVASNATPTDISLSPSSIFENNTIGDSIGVLSTTDADVGDTFTYSLVSGTGSDDNALFLITGNQLRAGGVFDFESQSSYSIRVRSTDAAGATFEEALTITIEDLNEAPM
jgi:large repetitive protein